MKKTARGLTAALALFGGLAVMAGSPGTARADLCTSASSCLLTLSLGNAGSSFGSGNFGTVDLELSGGVVTVTVDLASGFNIIKTGFPGSFGFTSGLASPTIGNFQAGATVAALAATAAYSGSITDAASDLHFDGFGDFKDAAATTGPSAGDSAAANVVRFTVGSGFTDVEQLLNLASPIGGDGAAYFVVDAINNNTTGPGAGKTGLIGVTGAGACIGPNCTVQEAPEPASVALLGMALVGLGAVRRRRRA